VSPQKWKELLAVKEGAEFSPEKSEKIAGGGVATPGESTEKRDSCTPDRIVRKESEERQKRTQ
jgi:hypothetical protein